MTQEQLRMQMLAGIITEGQYKEALEEAGYPVWPETLTDEKIDTPSLAAPEIPKTLTQYLGSKFRVVSVDKKVEDRVITCIIKIVGGLLNKELTFTYKFFGKDPENRLSQRKEELTMDIDGDRGGLKEFRRVVRGKYTLGLLGSPEEFNSVVLWLVQNNLKELKDRLFN
jgi:hypothetical protein